CACSSTGTGSVAGPAEKLKMRVAVFISNPHSAICNDLSHRGHRENTRRNSFQKDFCFRSFSLCFSSVSSVVRICWFSEFVYQQPIPQLWLKPCRLRR